MLVKSTVTKSTKDNNHCDDSNFFNDNIFTPSPPPVYTLNREKISASEAYEIVNSESYFDSNPELNLASYVTTWMEPEAEKIIKNTIDKNFIDKLIYPESVELERRCVSILVNLYNAKKEDNPVGTSTIGSTEAALLAGLNYKFMWKKWAKGRQLGKPEIIVGTNIQVCWEKFAKYFEVELIKVPIGADNTIDVHEVAKRLSNRIICVVGILGNTFSGEFDDIEALNDVVNNYNMNNDWKIPIHVDAASGGFVAPFCNKYKHIPWDFRLEWVKSINVSGHKYGFVYPGVGWALWRNAEDIDKDLIFNIDYLGGAQEDFSLNFSKNASNIIAQYYNLTRLGQEGYEDIIKYLFNIQCYLIKKFNELRVHDNKVFKIVNNCPGLPMVVLSLTEEGKKIGLDLIKLALKIKEYGWSIPVYPMPMPFEDEVVIRMVLRVGFNYGMAENLYEDMVKSIEYMITSQRNDSDLLSSGSHGVC